MARRRNKSRLNQTGRSNTSRFARLDYRLLNSNAYRALSPNARALLIEVVMLYNGENNGSLWLSVRDAAHRNGVADLTAASNAFAELQEMGFIAMTQDAYFRVKASDTCRARCWRLTWEAGPGRKGPSSEFVQREPAPHTKARKRMERGLRALKAYRLALSQNKMPVLDSSALAPFGPVEAPLSVLDSDTAATENSAFAGNGSVLESATHIATTIGSAANCAAIGWWQHDRMTRAAAWAAIITTSSMEKMAA
tara:strand:- start:1106 stop:1861 length:756 start_codon:yes stop_codon:yes gene_type:complete